MSKNKTLSAAKSAKNDEFYTQYADIQKEVNTYYAANPMYYVPVAGFHSSVSNLTRDSNRASAFYAF